MNKDIIYEEKSAQNQPVYNIKATNCNTFTENYHKITVTFQTLS